MRLKRALQHITEPRDQILSRQLSDLQQLDRALLPIEIELERKPGADGPDAVPLASEVKKLCGRYLSGDFGEIPPVKSANLRDIRARRAATKAAIAQTEQDWLLAVIAQAYDNIAVRKPEWNAVIAEELRLVCELQAIARRKAALAKEIRGKAPGPMLPCEFHIGILLSDGRSGGPAHEYLRAAVREGLTTTSEIARIRGDDERFVKDAFGL